MSDQYEHRTKLHRTINGCLIRLVVLLSIVLVGVLAYRFWLRPQVSQYVGRQIAAQIVANSGGPAAATQIVPSSIPSSGQAGAVQGGQGDVANSEPTAAPQAAPVTAQSSATDTGQAGGIAPSPTITPTPRPTITPTPQNIVVALPTTVAALPSGELRITEERANAYLTRHAAPIKAIESTTMHFVPNEVQIDIRAMGFTSTARMGLAVQDGRLVTVNPQLDGLLGQVIALPDLTRAMEQQLNDQLELQGRRVTDVRVEQGAIVVTIEG